MSITFFLADDHPMIRQGLRHLLDHDPGFRIIGEAGDGIETLQFVELLQPDILILDLMMPGLNGLEVLKQVKKKSPATHTIVLTMQSADAYIIEALRYGAAGYLLKESGPGELKTAIREVLKGNQFISAKISGRVQTGQRIEDLQKDAYVTLTDREREILQMTAEGRTSQEIGDKLAISSRTVELHRSNLMKKLRVHNRAELVQFAIQRRIFMTSK